MNLRDNESLLNLCDPLTYFTTDLGLANLMLCINVFLLLSCTPLYLTIDCCHGQITLMYSTRIDLVFKQERVLLTVFLYKNLLLQRCYRPIINYIVHFLITENHFIKYNIDV